MTEHLVWDDRALFKAFHALKAGRVVLSTTDTVLGLLAACTKEGFDALNQIKGRQEKPYLVLVADMPMAQSLVAQTDQTRLETLAKACWPGPVTCIFSADKGVPLSLQSREGSIGIRIPQHPQLLELLRLTGPLFSTSANRAGEAVPAALSAINPLLLESVAYVIEEKESQGHSSPIASTILDCTSDRIRLIREGVFAIDEIERKAGLRIKR